MLPYQPVNVIILFRLWATTLPVKLSQELKQDLTGMVFIFCDIRNLVIQVLQY